MDVVFTGKYLSFSLHIKLTFDRFSSTHQFTKPNDIRALNLANKCASIVMKDVQDAILAYGQSDEYRQVIIPQLYTFPNPI
jgi:tRNA(His) 5'-end guanylyltransferase